MTDKREQLSTIEQVLLECSTAEQAGVFERTRLEHEPIVPAALSSRGQALRRWALVGLPAAACLALAVGVASFLNHSGPQPRLVSSGGTSFYGCLHESGPGGGVLSDCARYDIDADGDVDLADFSAYQLACARSPR